MSISAIGRSASDLLNIKNMNLKNNVSEGTFNIENTEEETKEYSEYLNIKDEASNLFKKISTFDGYWSWQIDKIKEKIKQNIMSDMGVTEESMASMSETELNDLGKKVMEEVERIFKEMVENGMLKSQSLRGDRLSEGVVSTLLLDI